MANKGQVTVFVILGVIILIVGIFFIIFKESIVIGDLEEQKSDTIDQLSSIDQLSNINLFVEKCLIKSSEEALHLVLSQGGYYDHDDLNSTLNFFFMENNLIVPVYYSSEGPSLPTVDWIKKELGYSIRDHFKECIFNFDTFKSIGYAFSEPPLQIGVEFLEQDIDVLLNYPVVISFKDKQVTLQDFNVVIPLDFLTKYNQISNIINENYNLFNNQFDMLGWTYLAHQNNYSFDYLQGGDFGSKVIISLGYDFVENEDPLVYNFGLQYNWSDSDNSVDDI